MNLLKISLLTGCLFFFFLSQNFAQETSSGVATYEFQYNLSKKEMREMKQNLKKKDLGNLMKNPLNWQFKLKFKENKAVFYLDTLVNKKEDSSSILFTGYGYMGTPRYMNAEDKTIRYNFMTPKNELIVVNDNLMPVSWKILEETKTINGYKVQKASAYYQVNNAQRTVRNKKVTAWFSPEIPVELGPLQFGNLPGLIFEANLGDGFSYVLTAINFEQTVEIKELKAEREISKEAYDKKYTKIIN